MKNTLKTILYLSIAICCLSSCKDEMDVDTGANVKTETFKDFWWKKHEPVTVNAVINTQFDECEQLDGPLVLRLCDENGNAITPDVAKLYVQGKLSSDNTVVIEPKSRIKETEISIVLDESQLDRTKTFTWDLQVVDNPGLLKFNEFKPQNNDQLVGTRLNWTNKLKLNSLKVGVDTTAISLLSAFLIILLFCKARIKRFKAVTLDIDDCENKRDSITISSPRKFAKVVLTTTPGRKQNPLAAMFVGKVKYEYVEGPKWTSDVILIPTGRSLSDAGVDAFSSDSEYSFLNKGESIIITHPNKAKSKITW